MRYFHGFLGSLMAASLMQAETMAAMRHIVEVKTLDTNRPKTRKTGVTYPFSSKRQNDRYARQIAAGQLRMAGV